MIPTQSAVEKFVIASVFLLPATMGTIPSAASAINILLLLVALFLAWPAWQGLNRTEKILCFSMMAFFAAALISFLNSEDVSKSWARLERLLRVLAFIPIFLLFKRLNLDLQKPLILGMLLAGPSLLVSGFLTSESGAAQGAYNSILFGDFSAVVAIFLICYLLLKEDPWFLKSAAFLSFCSASYAMILSGTRGAWVAFLACASFTLAVFFAQQIRRKSFKKLSLPLLLAIIAIATAVQNPQVVNRTAQAISDLQNFTSGTDPHTSLGLRFQMWEAGVNIWAKTPFIGSGLGDYSVDLANMIASGESNITSHFGEAHSVFFEFLATTGLLGFGTLLFALFLLPLWLLRPSKGHNSDEYFISVCGVMSISAFFIFGLTQNWLGRSSITSVYILLLAIFAASDSSHQSKS